MNNIGSGIFFPLCALAFNIIILIAILTKTNVNTHETKIYKILVITNFIGLIIELLCTYAAYISNTHPLLSDFILKSYLAYNVIWTTLLFIYVVIITIPKEKFTIEENKIKLTMFILTLIILIIIYSTKCTLVVSPDFKVRYTTGFSVNFTFAVCGILVFLMFIYMLVKQKSIFTKRNVPILTFLILGSLCAVIQLLYPGMLIMTYVETIVVSIMYHTIENPDVKLLNEVRIAKEQAEKANAAKTDFLSNMSHEIRTPLNAIVGFSESLKEDNLQAESREKVDDIITASNNLLEIVNGILDISKIEANKIEIINKEYNVNDMLKEIVALTKARIGSKPLTLNVKIDKALPCILYGDNIRLKQVIINLLTNAVKYTKEGYIDFTVSTVIKDNICRLIISVEDTGIGMKKEDLNKLFTKFERLGVEKQITIEGTGLGLAITKKLVDLMNGKIIVQSVYGKGSKFTISIDQRIVSVENTLTPQPKMESKLIDANGSKILLVDDNELNIKVAATLLKKYNFDIDSCTSGFACLEKIKEQHYDLIFMDDMMPKMTGKQTLKRLKEDPNFKTPVVVLTANAITGLKEEYIAFGFDDYLSKPINKAELERVIKENINLNHSKNINGNKSTNTSSVIQNKIDIDLPVLANDSSKTAPSNDELSKKDVLLVDDNDLNLKVANLALKKYNLNVDSVTSGSEAIEKVISKHYDLILMDDMMPDLDGSKTLDNLRTIENFETPTILMTASPYDEVKDKITEHKFDGYLGKPIDKEKLRELLNSFLK